MWKVFIHGMIVGYRNIFIICKDLIYLETVQKDHNLSARLKKIQTQNTVTILNTLLHSPCAQEEYRTSNKGMIKF